MWLCGAHSPSIRMFHCTYPCLEKRTLVIEKTKRSMAAKGGVLQLEVDGMAPGKTIYFPLPKHDCWREGQSQVLDSMVSCI